jgi:hypothetical protein
MEHPLPSEPAEGFVLKFPLQYANHSTHELDPPPRRPSRRNASLRA